MSSASDPSDVAANPSRTSYTTSSDFLAIQQHTLRLIAVCLNWAKNKLWPLKTVAPSAEREVAATLCAQIGPSIVSVAPGTKNRPSRAAGLRSVDIAKSQFAIQNVPRFVIEMWT